MWDESPFRAGRTAAASGFAWAILYITLTMTLRPFVRWRLKKHQAGIRRVDKKEKDAPASKASFFVPLCGFLSPKDAGWYQYPPDIVASPLAFSGI